MATETDTMHAQSRSEPRWIWLMFSVSSEQKRAIKTAAARRGQTMKAFVLERLEPTLAADRAASAPAEEPEIAEATD